MPGNAYNPGSRGPAQGRLIKRSWRATFWGLLRAALVLGFIVTVASFAWLRSAEARISEALLGFGAELSEWSGAQPHSKPRRLTVNGLELGLLSASTELGVGSVLDHFEKLCQRKGALVAPASVLKRLGVSTDLATTSRQGSDAEGVLACLDLGGKVELSELARRLTRFGETGDLAEIGELRYVLARRSGKTTTLLVLWTEGRTEILRAFPKEGDAPGRDPVARSPGSRRLLFAGEHGAPYSVSVYTSIGQRPDALLGWYARDLAAGGWTIDPRPAEGGLVARRDSRTLLIKAGQTRAGHAVVSVSELSS